MQPLNYHHLLYFYVVAREGSIARATTVLDLTQPTISGQLRTLEQALGERLFERRGRNLVLTETGHVIYRYAEEIFSLGDELLRTLQGQPTSGPLRFAVGISDSLPKLTTYRLLAPALALQTPMRLLLRIGKTDQLLADLSIHALDLVLSDAPINPGVKVRAFNHLLGECDVTVFATAANAEKYRRNFPRSLQDAPFLLPTQGTALRRSLEQWFEAEDIHPTVAAEVEDVALLQVLGQEGLGLFAAPTVVEDEIKRQYGVRPVGRIEAVKERFYAISIDRKLKHPAVLAISKAAKNELFS
ncbi:MAG TPA: transcriptional activator NhaR [Gemmatimonadales bacterium]|nr:transcriptional activator NhaR [Gemmatimonadales bacterium]